MERLPHILVIPFPAQGHITPMVEFSHQAVDHGARVTFLTPEPIHKKLFPTSADGMEERKASMLNFISFPHVLPNLTDLSNGSRHPIDVLMESMIAPVEESILKMRDSGEKIDCVVADASLGMTLEVVHKLGIQVASFMPASLGVLAFTLHVPNLIEAGVIDHKGVPSKEEDITLPLTMPAISRVDLMWAGADPIMQGVVFAFISHVNRGSKVAKYTLSNSFDALEPSSLGFIPNILTIGPLLARDRPGHSNGQLFPEDSTCLAWLDQQPAQSVTYIAFGSTAKFDQKQFDELVQGLELLSGPFLCALRPDLTEGLSTSYLDAFKDRIATRGRILQWAPQKEVLAHPAIACFITHCGWNSVMEGVSNGVPSLCWPYAGDQLHNQNYICSIWKVGLKFEKNENGVITSSEIQAKVQELLGDEGIRSRANNLRDLAKRSISPDGSSLKNFQGFIQTLKC